MITLDFKFDIFAVLAFIVSVISMATAVKSYLLNCKRVKVKVDFCHIFHSSFTSEQNNQVYISISAVNVGGKPVSLTEMGFILKDKTTGVMIPGVFPNVFQFPYELKPEKSHQMIYALDDDLSNKTHFIKYAYAKDETGKKYKHRFNEHELNKYLKHYEAKTAIVSNGVVNFAENESESK